MSRKMIPEQTVEAWTDSLVAIGHKPLSTDAYLYAMKGYLPEGGIPTVTLMDTVGGKLGRGMHHFDTTCARIKGAHVENTITLGEWAKTPKSKRHACCQGIDNYLPDWLILEIGILHDARLLTRPYRSAKYSSGNLECTVIPYDSTPIEAGLLENLTGVVYEYALTHPERPHMIEVHEELLKTLEDWKFLLQNKEDILTNDPHMSILRWQRALGLPELAGSVNQVRWAEQIRYEMMTLGVAPEITRIATHEPSARAWIALHQQPSEDPLEQWLGMKEREMNRLKDKVKALTEA